MFNEFGGLRENFDIDEGLGAELDEGLYEEDPNNTNTQDDDFQNDFDIPEDGVHAKWIYFKANSLSSNVVLNPAKWLHGQPEHSEYKWLDSLSDLEQLDMCDEHKSVLKKILKRLVKKVNKY